MARFQSSAMDEDSSSSNSSFNEDLKVDVNSPTPYTDATQSKKPTTHIKRPMNPFMVWSKQERKRMSQAYPTMHNAEISKRLGKLWKEMTPEMKQPYYDKARKLQVMHKQQFPDYKYMPRKKPKGGDLIKVVANKPQAKRAKASPKPKAPPRRRYAKTPVKEYTKIPVKEYCATLSPSDLKITFTDSKLIQKLYGLNLYTVAIQECLMSEASSETDASAEASPVNQVPSSPIDCLPSPDNENSFYDEPVVDGEELKCQSQDYPTSGPICAASFANGPYAVEAFDAFSNSVIEEMPTLQEEYLNDLNAATDFLGTAATDEMTEVDGLDHMFLYDAFPEVLCEMDPIPENEPSTSQNSG